jgi:hypothetical protein
VYRKTNVGLLLQLNPKLARGKILDAYRQHGGRNDDTSKALGVSYATLGYWIRQLEARGVPIRRDIARIRAAAQAEADGV